MAVAHVASAKGYAPSGTLTFAGPNCTGANLLVVGVTVASASPTITSVTHNGQEMTAVPGSGRGNTYRYVKLFYRVTPNASGNVVVTFSAGDEQTRAYAHAFSGVDTSDPFGTVVYATGFTSTSSALTVTDGAAGDLVFSTIFARNASTPFSSDGDNERQDTGDGQGIRGSCTQDGAASVTITWTWSVGSDGGVHEAVNINAAASASTFVPQIILMG